MAVRIGRVARNVLVAVLALAFGMGVFAGAPGRALGPFGGDILSLGVNPRMKSVVYAGTSFGLFISRDGGETWQSINQAMPNPSAVTAIAVNPKAPQTVYAVTEDGVLVSTDEGAHWTTAAPYGGYSPCLAVNPKNPSILYVGNSNGIHESEDGGKTWTDVNQGLTNTLVKSLAIDPRHPRRMYAGTYGYLQGDCLFKSNDGGASWKPVTVDKAYPYLNVTAIAINPSRPRTLYIGTDNDGIYKSIDAGRHWHFLKRFGYTLVRSLAVAHIPSHAVFAATWGEGVMKSPDGGHHWHRCDTGLPTSNVWCVVPGKRRTLYAGTAEGFAATRNKGRSWTASNAGLAGIKATCVVADSDDPGVLIAGTEGHGVFRSDDGGDTWTETGMSGCLVNDLTRSGAESGTLYAAVVALIPSSRDSGIWKSTDDGRTWSRSGLEGAIVSAVAADPASPGTVYAGTNAGALKSLDGGQTWNALSSGFAGHAVHALAVDPVSPSVVIAGTAGGGIYRSTDGGANWTLRTPGGGSGMWIQSIKADPGTPGVFYAAAWVDGVFESDDGGVTWTNISANDMPHLGALDVRADEATGSLYAATDGGVFVRPDAASPWTALDMEFSHPFVSGLALDPVYGTLYAATVFGLYSYALTE